MGEGGGEGGGMGEGRGGGCMGADRVCLSIPLKVVQVYVVCKVTQ